MFIEQLSRNPTIRWQQIISCAPTKQMSKVIQKRMHEERDYTLEEISDIKTLAYLCITFRTYLSSTKLHFGISPIANDEYLIELIKKMQFNILFESDVFKEELVSRLNYYKEKIK